MPSPCANGRASRAGWARPIGDACGWAAVGQRAFVPSRPCTRLGVLAMAGHLAYELVGGVGVPLASRVGGTAATTGGAGAAGGGDWGGGALSGPAGGGGGGGGGTRGAPPR